MARPNKYRNVKRVVQSIVFDPRMLHIMKNDCMKHGVSLSQAIENGLLKLYNSDSCEHLEIDYPESFENYNPPPAY